MTPLCALIYLLLTGSASAGNADTVGPAAGPVLAINTSGLLAAGVRLDAPLFASESRQGRVPGPPPLQLRLGAELWVTPHTAIQPINTTSLNTMLSVRRTLPQGLVLEGSVGLSTARSRDVIKREPTWTTAPVLQAGVGTDLWMARHRPITAVIRPQVALVEDAPVYTVSLAVQRRLDLPPGR